MNLQHLPMPALGRSDPAQAAGFLERGDLFFHRARAQIQLHGDVPG